MKIGIDARPLTKRLTGIGIYIYHVLNELAKNDPDNEYYLYATNEFSESVANPRWRQITGRGPFSVNGTLYFETVLTNRLNKDKIDVFWGTQHVLPLNHRGNCILTIHDFAWMEFPETIERFNLLVQKLFLKRSIMKADHIISVSYATAAYLKKYFHVPEEKISVIHHGLSDIYKPFDKGESAAYISRKYGTAKDYILTVGTVEPRKNIAALLRAYKTLLEKGEIKDQLLIVGARGWKNSNIIHVYRELRLNEDIVKFLGYIEMDDMPRLYSGANLFVFPSLYEGFGFPPLEAMKCGCPVVVAKTSSLPEVCREAAYYVEPRNIQSISAGIREVQNNDNLRNKLICSGLKHVKEFTWNKCAGETLQAIYRSTSE